MAYPGGGAASARNVGDGGSSGVPYSTSVTLNSAVPTVGEIARRSGGAGVPSHPGIAGLCDPCTSGVGAWV